MVYFPLKKCYYVSKLCGLFILVVTVLSLFERYRGGQKSTVATTELEVELERQIVEDEARIIPSLGEGGVPAILDGEGKRLGEESEKQYAINVYLSDRIPYNRTLKDFRNPSCKRVIYDAELPSASVIIIFHNEPYSVVIRTLWSVINSARRENMWFRTANYIDKKTGRGMNLGYKGQDNDSPFVYLKEIILVDDNSTLPELKDKLSHYVRTRLPPDLIRILRLPDRRGIAFGRHSGARLATGAVLVFLDAHCEANRDWLRPILQRIKESPKSTVTPVIDMLNSANLGYEGPDHVNVGGFTFSGHFIWIDVPEREKKRRGTDISPTWSPTMAGGLFAIKRSYYWELGAYDEQMSGWGGENLEMSFRIWQCGGTLETLPCSRVGHVFRSFHPYGLPANTDTHGINTARMAEVWMDDYAELFYLHRPDLRKSDKIGDVTHRRVLREKLRCKSFQWYLDNIYKEKFVPVRDVDAFGRFMNPLTGLCLDTLQRESEPAPLGVYPCHSSLQPTQYLSLSLTSQLRDEERCAHVHTHARRDNPEEEEIRSVMMMSCRPHQRGQKWRYIPSTQQIQNLESRLCLSCPHDAGADVTAVSCDDNKKEQRWHIDYTDNSLGDLHGNNVDPSLGSQEVKLQKLRGQRRISRSLLSHNNDSAATRRRKNKKNKFVLKLLRTVNGTEQHLEADIHCKHRTLYPNDTFVRDIVSILNEKDIKVINNGRVFEKNRVYEVARKKKKNSRSKSKFNELSVRGQRCSICPNVPGKRYYCCESIDKKDPDLLIIDVENADANVNNDFLKVRWGWQQSDESDEDSDEQTLAIAEDNEDKIERRVGSDTIDIYPGLPQYVVPINNEPTDIAVIKHTIKPTTEYFKRYQKNVSNKPTARQVLSKPIDVYVGYPQYIGPVVISNPEDFQVSKTTNIPDTDTIIVQKYKSPVHTTSKIKPLTAKPNDYLRIMERLAINEKNMKDAARYAGIHNIKNNKASVKEEDKLSNLNRFIDNFRDIQTNKIVGISNNQHHQKQSYGNLLRTRVIEIVPPMEETWISQNVKPVGGDLNRIKPLLESSREYWQSRGIAPAGGDYLNNLNLRKYTKKSEKSIRQVISENFPDSNNLPKLFDSSSIYSQNKNIANDQLNMPHNEHSPRNVIQQWVYIRGNDVKNTNPVIESNQDTAPERRDLSLEDTEGLRLETNQFVPAKSGDKKDDDIPVETNKEYTQNLDTSNKERTKHFKPTLENAQIMHANPLNFLLGPAYPVMSNNVSYVLFPSSSLNAWGIWPRNGVKSNTIKTLAEHPREITSDDEALVSRELTHKKRAIDPNDISHDDNFIESWETQPNKVSSTEDGSDLKDESCNDTLKSNNNNLPRRWHTRSKKVKRDENTHVERNVVPIKNIPRYRAADSREDKALKSKLNALKRYWEKSMNIDKRKVRGMIKDSPRKSGNENSNHPHRNNEILKSSMYKYPEDIARKTVSQQKSYVRTENQENENDKSLPQYVNRNREVIQVKLNNGPRKYVSVQLRELLPNSKVETSKEITQKFEVIGLKDIPPESRLEKSETTTEQSMTITENLPEHLYRATNQRESEKEKENRKSLSGKSLQRSKKTHHKAHKHKRLHPTHTNLHRKHKHSGETTQKSAKSQRRNRKRRVKITKSQIREVLRRFRKIKPEDRDKLRALKIRWNELLSPEDLHDTSDKDGNDAAEILHINNNPVKEDTNSDDNHKRTSKRKHHKHAAADPPATPAAPPPPPPAPAPTSAPPAPAAERKIIIEDFVVVTSERSDSTTTASRGFHPNKAQFKSLGRKRRRKRVRSQDADAPIMQRARRVSAEDSERDDDEDNEQEEEQPALRARESSEQNERDDDSDGDTSSFRSRHRHSRPNSSGERSMETEPPLKLVMRSNLTFNLEDELLRTKPDDVASLLGELVIPESVKSPKQPRDVRTRDVNPGTSDNRVDNDDDSDSDSDSEQA